MIGSAIQSVLDQTFTEFETLVVDDGSTDHTEQVLNSFSDPRLVYLRQEHSGHPAVARNTGLKRARGNYIAFLDSDDLWTSDKLTIQVAYMDAHPEVALSFTNAYIFRKDPGERNKRLILEPGMRISGQAFHQLYGPGFIPNLTVVIRASVVDTVGFMDEDARLKANEDHEYWLRIAHRFPIGYIDKPLALYRQHQEGISRAAEADSQAKIALIEKLDRLYPEFVANHRRERDQWLSVVHYRLGRVFLREGRTSAAQRQFLYSWRSFPMLRALAFLLASCLGKRIYTWLDGLAVRILGS
jgi:glycosyltransferase involved in cell wall biosynthesis